MRNATLETWTAQALCTDNPDMWSADGWLARARAAHICGHCPVKPQCADELSHTPRELLIGMVVAGIPHSHQGKPITWTLPRQECGLCP